MLILIFRTDLLCVSEESHPHLYKTNYLSRTKLIKFIVKRTCMPNEMLSDSLTSRTESFTSGSRPEIASSHVPFSKVHVRGGILKRLP